MYTSLPQQQGDGTVTCSTRQILAVIEEIVSKRREISGSSKSEEDELEEWEYQAKRFVKRILGEIGLRVAYEEREEFRVFDRVEYETLEDSFRKLLEDIVSDLSSMHIVQLVRTALFSRSASLLFPNLTFAWFALLSAAFH